MFLMLDINVAGMPHLFASVCHNFMRLIESYAFSKSTNTSARLVLRMLACYINTYNIIARSSN